MLVQDAWAHIWRSWGFHAWKGQCHSGGKGRNFTILHTLYNIYCAYICGLGFNNSQAKYLNWLFYLLESMQHTLGFTSGHHSSLWWPEVMWRQREEWNSYVVEWKTLKLCVELRRFAEPWNDSLWVWTRSDHSHLHWNNTHPLHHILWI